MAWPMLRRCMLGNSNKFEERKGYLFHPIDDEADGDVALNGKCPELVRVDNCTAWRPMSSVLPNITRVVHPDDIKMRMIHVAGRALHFVCGVAGVEGKGTFTFRKIARSTFYTSMYPEEALGSRVQSASMMWEQIERLFNNIRIVSRKSGSARSGPLSMEWTARCMNFVEVTVCINYGYALERNDDSIYHLTSCTKGMTMPSKQRSVLGRQQSRLDATLGFQNVSYDVDRLQLKYTSRL